jgi:hypothetical protein
MPQHKEKRKEKPMSATSSWRHFSVRSRALIGNTTDQRQIKI